MGLLLYRREMRTYIYIDGFNFYYGAVKGTPFKWLDFRAFFTCILKSHNQVLSMDSGHGHQNERVKIDE